MTYKPNRLTEYTRKAIVAEIRRVVTEHFGGQPPKQQEFNRYSRVHSGTVVKHMGTWGEAMNTAGYDYPGRRVTVAALRSDLKRVLGLAGGKFFTQVYYVRNGGRFSPRTLKSRLGYADWASMLQQECGVRKRPNTPSRTELLTELRRVWTVLGRRPRYGEFRDLGKIGTKVYARAFGSWTKAVQALCEEDGLVLQRSKFTHANTELLQLELAAIAGRHDGPIMQYEDYRCLGGTHSISTFQRHFGSWRNAVAAVGLKDGHARERPDLRQYCDEDCFREIQRLWEMFGRQPTTREMTKHGAMSVDVFHGRFGSWMRAVHAFCRDRSATDETTSTDCVAAGPAAAEIAYPDAPPQDPGTPTEAREEERGIVEMATPRQPSLRLRFQVLRRDHFTCVYCGRSPARELGVQLEVDHVHPYSQGGETLLDNLQTLCRACNAGKSDTVL